jgi:hypothetical protein
VAEKEVLDMTPFVVLVGCARSGTTLLQRVVDAHPQIALTPEMHWITKDFKRLKWPGPKRQVTAEQVAGMMEHERFLQFDFTRQQFEGLLGAGEPVSYKTFFHRFFALYGQIKQKPLVGNKTPNYVRRIPALHALWPEAKFVHLMRDGRDVCLSVLNWDHAGYTAGRYATWAEDRVSTTALWWKRKVQFGRQGGQALPPGLYHEVRYEDLVARPAEECAKLCAFLGVPYDEGMLRFHEGKTRTDPGLDAKEAWLPITPGLRNWRTQMPAAEVERFEAAAGDLLDELGYSRAFPRPSADCLSHARRLRDLFTQELHARSEALPGCW